MKDFEDGLNALVEKYAQKVGNTYQEKKTMDDEQRQRIEASLIGLFSYYLSKDGLSKEKIEKNARQLAKKFHHDKLPSQSPQIQWLEFILSRGEKDAAATFKLISYCEERLNNPKTFHHQQWAKTGKRTNTSSNQSHAYFSDLKDLNDLIERLETQKKEAKIYTQIALLDSIIVLLRSVNDYHSNSNLPKGSNPWVERFLNTMPYVTSGICIGFWADELALLFALTFCISQGGRWLEKNGSGRVKMLGRHMQFFGSAIGVATSILLSRVVAVNFFLVKNMNYYSIEAGLKIYRLLTSAPQQTTQASPSEKRCEESESAQPQNTMPAEHMELALHPQNLLGGKAFNHLELKLIAMPLEAYSEKQSQQLCAYYRKGDQKSALLKSAVKQLRQIDGNSQPLSIKLQQIEPILQTLLSDRNFRNTKSESYKAIHAAETLYKSLNPLVLPLQETQLLQIEAASDEIDGKGKEKEDYFQEDENHSMVLS